MSKVCRKCNQLKSFGDFTKDRTHKDGMGSYCKPCYNQMRKDKRKNKDYAKREQEYGKKWRLKKIKENPDYTRSLYLKYKGRYKYKNNYSKRDWISISLSSVKSSKKPYDKTIDRLFFEDLLKKQCGKCYYTGVVLDLKNRKSPYCISVDRVDSSKGYYKDNIVLCARSINFAKNSFSEDIFISFLKDVSKKFFKKI